MEPVCSLASIELWQYPLFAGDWLYFTGALQVGAPELALDPASDLALHPALDLPHSLAGP